MNVNLYPLIKQGETVAVALSGGSDSMSLLYYMFNHREKFGLNLIALNVEHGIRGNESISDTEFVKEQCKKLGIPLLTYSVDCVKHSKNNKLSIEQSARLLRYECFYDAINSGKCDKIATAHHADDNLESVLFNLLRGTGIKGLSGIKQNFENKIIRPFLAVSKAEIEQYVKENSIPFVIDSTNTCDKYSRNFLRLNVIPKIKEIFPDAVKSVYRLSEIASREDQFLEDLAEKSITEESGRYLLPVNTPKAVFYRAVIIVLKKLGLEKDWESVHADDVYSLTTNENGSRITLPKNVFAIKEYENVVFFTNTDVPNEQIPFSLGNFQISNKNITIKKQTTPVKLDSGLFGDLDKIPSGAVIRTKKKGDKFTKFGGGSKSLGDFLTDKKIPLRERDLLPLIAVESEILCVFGVAVSDKIKVDDKTKTIINFSVE